MHMTTNAALGTTIAAVVAAIIGIAVAAGLNISKDLQDHILAFITIATPAIVGLIAWMHHTSGKVNNPGAK